MRPVDDLISRFVEDPGAATPEQLEELTAALREQPEMAVRLREQLMLDDLLAQKLTVDRRNFLAQVEQRIADYERAQDEIDSQVADLRAIAETEIERPNRPRGPSLWMNLLMVAAAAALIAGVFLAPDFLARGRAVARVESVQGEVATVVGQGFHHLAVGEVLKTDQHVNVPAGGSLVFVYADKTRVELAGGTRVIIGGNPRTGAKALSVAQGEVLASVAKQTAGPMLFNTPHAVATVLGTELRITVDDAATRLDVTEGLVQLAKTDGARPVLVAANETGEVRGQELLPKRSLAWPDNRDSVVFLFEGNDELVVARNPNTGNFRDTPLTKVDSASAEMLDLQMFGGQFVTEEGGVDVVQLCQRTSELGLEAIITAERPRMEGTIAALASKNGRGNFELAQERDRLTFRLSTDATMDAPVTLDLGPIEADRQTYVAVTYRDGALIGYVDGTEVARREDVRGGLGSWPEGPLAIGGDSVGAQRWRGSVAGFAIHNQAMDAAAIARNVRNFRGLHFSAARQPKWTGLMSDDDPATHWIGGWKEVEFAWENEGAGERLRLAPVKGDYDARVELHVVRSAGEAIELLLPVGNRHVAAVLQPPGSASKVNGLELVDLLPASETKSGLLNRQLELQRIYTIEARVRVEGENARIVATVDGEPWVDWSGPRASLSLKTERQDWAEESPVLSVGKNVVRVHSLKVRQYP